MTRSFIISICLVFFSISFFAQTHFPENGELFIDTTVPRIDISVDPDTLEWLYQSENLESDIEYTASFVFDNGNIRDTVYPVGFRLRGNTSRYSQKKSFKISFNRFTQGGKYYNVEKLNLNGEHNDPSVIRSKVCWDIVRKMELPGPRSNHVRVYINGDYYGLYINVEHEDEEFIKSRYAYNDGNFYKCLWPANLNYLGSDPDLYKFEQGNRRAYDLKINEEADDYSDIAHFIDVLNNTPISNLKCKLDEVFNTYDYLKVIAADVLFGNWDGYIYNQNNFYLYHNTISDKMEFIHYDLDNTLGIDWLDRDWGNRNIYDWAQHGDNYRPLYERIMEVDELRDQYTFYMNQLVTKTLNFDSLQSAIEERRDMIAPYLMSDPYYPLDYGYTLTDFYNSYNQALGGHVDYGLFPYIQTRVNAINSQLENTTMKPVIKYISYNRTSPSEVWVKSFIDVENMAASASIIYKPDGGTTAEAEMHDDGQHNDGEAGDHVFGGVIDNIPDSASVTFQVKAIDESNFENTMPCEPVFVPKAGTSDIALFINEFMASNSNTIADEHGDYDDWIEVYNATSETIWLGDKYLTDNLNNRNKWQMPNADIESGQFLIFWADGEPEQGPFHANFKLSKDGEDVGLFDSSLEEIDAYVFGQQESDISEGRFPNGNDNWVFFEKPTPGESNELTSVPELNADKIHLYPNPASGGKVYLSQSTNFKVYNSLGKLILKEKNSQNFNISSYNKGMYFVVTDDGHRIKLLVQ